MPNIIDKTTLAASIAEFLSERYDITEKADTKVCSLSHLKAKVAEAFNVTTGMMEGNGQARAIVDARKMYAYIAKEKYATSDSLVHIGSHINKDHSMLIYYIDKAQELIDTSKHFKNTYEQLIALIA